MSVGVWYVACVQRRQCTNRKTPKAFEKLFQPRKTNPQLVLIGCECLLRGAAVTAEHSVSAPMRWDHSYMAFTRVSRAHAKLHPHRCASSIQRGCLALPHLSFSHTLAFKSAGQSKKPLLRGSLNIFSTSIGKLYLLNHLQQHAGRQRQHR